MNDSLSLTYSRTMDDIVAWTQYHSAHSASYKRLYGIQVAFVSAILFVAFWAISGFGDTGAITAALATAVIFCIMLSQRKRGIARYVKKTYAEGKNEGMIGQHRLLVTDDGLTDNSETGELKTRWAGIERVVEIPGYTFVYISAASALVVSERGVSEGDYSAFMAELKRRWDAAQRERATQ